jgi:hypothetical protein
MPPAIPLRKTPRTLANVVIDLREARSDWEEAIASAEHATATGDDNAADEFGDRATEADDRIDALREEFAERFVAATGLTWKQIEAAISEAVL